MVTKAQYFEMIGYKPHARQLLYHQAEERFKVPVCGRRFGKSTMAARDFGHELYDPNKRFWIVGPTYDLGEKEFRVLWDDLIIGQRLGNDKRVLKRYNKKQGDMFIEFPWQTRIEVRSADHPENLVGEALHGIIMSEAAKHRPDTFERYLRAALADYRGWATFPTTPEGQNWLYQLWQLGRNPDFMDYASWRFPSWDNPYLYPGGRDDPEIKLLEATTASEWFEQEIAADFTAFVGKIYGEFQEDIHVAKVPFNPAWPNYVCFDFGFVNPLAAVEFQIDPMDRVHIWREHYKAFTTLEEHIRIMQARPQPEGYRIDMCFGDAADPEAVAVLNQRFGPTRADPDAKSNWREGVELVKTFLAQRVVGESDEYGTPLERPWLQIDHTCQNVIREFNNYRAPNQVGGRNPRNPRETAHGIDDHAIDAVRYGLMHIFKLGALHHLSETVDRTYSTTSEDAGYFTTTKDF